MSKAKKETTQGKENNLVVAIVVALVLCVFVGIFIWAGKSKNEYTSTADKGQNSTISSTESDTQQQEGLLDTSLTYYADIKVEDYGTVTVKLDPSSAPITCANFVCLANDKFYDGLTFHRIIENFMIQGGDPKGNGTGGSDKNIVGEFTSNGYNNTLSHTRGAISMARSGNPNSASSQFFIVHKDSPHLDGDYAVFGYVTEGIDVVDKVCADAKPIDGNGTIPANAQPTITSITIRTE